MAPQEVLDGGTGRRSHTSDHDPALGSPGYSKGSTWLEGHLPLAALAGERLKVVVWGHLLAVQGYSRQAVFWD